MAENNNLQFGINFEPDLSAFEASWKAQESKIQGIIDKHVFQVKVQANQDLDKLEAQLRRIADLQAKSAKPLTAYQAGKLDIARETALLKEQTDAINRTAMAQQKLATERERTSKMAAQAAQAQQRLNQSQERGVVTTGNLTSAFRTQAGILNGLHQFLNQYLSILGAYRLVNNIKDITSEFELQRVSLRAITQDAEYADALFARIKAVAVESPFSVKEMITYTKQLAAYRIENEKLYDTMNMLADVSAGLGVDMNRLILAYGQVKAAAVLRGQELRQFTEAGIPMVEQLAIKFSQLKNEVVSTGDVFELISKRQVPFEMVAEIFEDMTKKGGKFYEMQKKQAESLYGVYANLKDNLQIAMDEIGRSSRGLFMEFGKAMTFLAKNLQSVLDFITVGATAFLTYKTAILLVGNAENGLAASKMLVAAANKSLMGTESAVDAVRSRAMIKLRLARVANDKYAVCCLKAALANNTLTRSFWKLSAAVVANPIVAALTAIIAVVVASTTAWKRKIDTLASAEEAQKRVARLEEENRQATNEAKEALESYVGAIKEQDILLKSQKHSYEDFKKIYPELAKRYKTEEEYSKALTEAYDKRKEAIQALKAAYGQEGYFDYLDEENFKVEDLTQGYLDMNDALREQEKIKLESRKNEIQAEIARQQTIVNASQNFQQSSMGAPTYAQAGIGFISGVNESKAKATIEGLQHELDGVNDALGRIAEAFSISGIAAQNWRQVYKENVETLGEQQLAELSLSDAIDDTRKKYKSSKKAIEEYKDALAKLKEAVKAASGQAAADIQSDIDDITNKLADEEKVMSGLKTFAKYMGFDPDTKQTKKDNSKALEDLKDQYALVGDVYKRYQQLRKSMNDDAAKQEIQDIYGSMFKGGIDFLDENAYKEKLEKLKKRAKALGDNSLALKIDLAIHDIDLENLKKNLSQKLEKLSQEISRAKTGVNLFESMLGLTGDTKLSTQITIALTGLDVVADNVRDQLAEQLATILGDAAISPEVEASLNLKPADGEDATAYIARIKQMLVEGNIAVADFNNLISSINDKDLKSKLESALKEFIDYDTDLLKDFFGTIKKSEDVATQRASLERTRDSKSDPKRVEMLNKLKPSNVDEATWTKWIDDYLKAVQAEFDAGSAKLDFSAFKEKFAETIADMDSASVAALDAVIGELKGFLDMPGVDPTMLKSIQELIEKASDVKISKTPLKSFIEGWKQVAGAAKKATKEEKKAEEAAGYSKMSKAIKQAKSDWESVSKVINDVIDLTEDIADAIGVEFGAGTKDAIEGFKTGISVTTAALSVMASVIAIIEAEMWPLLVVALAIGAAFAAIKWFSNKDRREADTAIKGYDKHLNKLKEDYKDLEAIEKRVLGGEWIANQNAQIRNYEHQITDLNAKIEAEKKVKANKINHDNIEEWESTKRDLEREIAELKAGIGSTMAGTDLVSAAKDFAEAWLEAYLSFGDTTAAIKDKFKEMMQSMVINSVLARVVQAKLKPLFDYIDNELYGDDGTMKGSLAEVWRRMKEIGETLPEELEKVYEGIGSWIGDLHTSESNLSGIAKGVSQATEESVLTLSGYANSILYYHVQEASDLAAIRAILEGKTVVATNLSQQSEGGSLNVGQLITVQQNLLAQVTLIKNDTSAIRDDIADIKGTLNTVVAGPSTTSPKTVNVKIR